MTRYKKTMSEAYREVYNICEKMSSSQIAKLKKAYEPMRGKKISTANAEKLMKIMDMVDKDKNVLIQLFKADIPFVSELAVTRLITKHKMKGAEINKLKSEALDKEDEPKVKEIIKKLKGASQAHAGQAKDLEKAVSENLDEKYDLYHKTFSGAMQHAYDYAKKKMGITVDPKEIDSKVATGPRKPSEGKTNTYRLKGRGGNLQIQVYNKGGSKPFELNMYKESVELDEKVEYVEYKFKNKNDAMKAKKMLDAVQLMGFEINDDNISNGELMVDAGNKDMTKYHKEIMKKFRPKVMTQESLEEKYSPKEIKMAIGIASDPRYAKGNYSGAVRQIEKIKKGLSTHKQVAAVLKRQNEELDESKEALKKKAEKSGVSVGILSKVYDRGMAAWKGGHRPGTTPQQWALARVNSFLTGGGARKADNDLWKKAKKEEVELDEMSYKPGSFKDTKPQEKGAKEFDKLIKTGGMDKKDFQKARQLYVQASDAASREKLKKFIFNLDTEPLEAIMDLIGRNDPDTFNKMYPKSKPGEYLSSISYNHRNVKAEETELDEMKMNDPKLIKVFDKLKPKDTIKLKVSSGISKGKDFQPYTVRAKNTLRNGTEKITMILQGNPTGVKRFLYKRDGKVTFAIGDMAASIDDIKEDAVKAAQDKLDKAKRIQSLKDRIKDIRDEGARADAMRAMRTKRGVDPADVDDDATDDDMKAASKNIIMQLRKSVSLGKNFKVEFGDKKKMPVDPKIAQAVMNKYMSFRKPMDKEKFQSKIAKSYKDMLRAMKESIHEEEEKPDNTKFTDRIKKAQERVKNATKGTQEHSDALDALKNAKDAYAEYRKKTTGGKVKSALKKAAIGGALGAIATAKLGDSYDPKIKREAILDRIDKILEEKKDG